jgi:predicted ribonuclease YlaK
MRKTYILDTSTLICDPFCHKNFKHSDIIIPIAVLNELDNLKKQSNETGKNARICIKMLDEISSQGDISQGVLLADDILVKIDTTYFYMNSPDYAGLGEQTYGDTQILACALLNFKNHPSNDVTLVSNDINLRVKAKSRSLNAIAYEYDSSDVNELYSGVKIIKNAELGEELQKRGSINPLENNISLLSHECVYFQDDDDNILSMGRKVDEDKIKLIKKHTPWGVHSKNKEQAFAMDLIMDKNIDLITLIGKAGTGKSLVVLACALELVLSKKEYNKLIIYRPIQSVGNDIGYLPGPQPLDAKIATPNGWTTMGELKVGDYVISKDGMPSKILQIFPKGKKEVFKITTTDGTSTEACGDHPWAVKTLFDRQNNANYRIVTTNEMKHNIKSGNTFNYQLPRNSAVQFSKKDLPIPAYSLGVYLGDGSCTDNHFTIYSKDEQIVNRVQKELKHFDMHMICQKTNKLSYRFYPNKQSGKSGAMFVLATNVNDNSQIEFSSISSAANYFNYTPSSISRLCRNGKVSKEYKFEYLDKKMTSSHPIISKLKEIGLNGKRSWEKYIPDIYKYSSVEDRINVLRGLMDTDGTIKENGECSFTTTSKQLAEDVTEVVRSLGGRACVHSRNRVGKSNKTGNVVIESKRVSYEFTISMPNTINPFYLNRKSNRFNVNKNPAPIAVKSIESVGEKEVQCILIDNSEHLYLTDNFIVTHNTLGEKLAPWFQAILDNFELLFSSKNSSDWRRTLEIYQKKGQIEMEAITYIRGRSIPNSIIIVDECQNITKEDIKTILTRAGEGTKIILTGDIEQIDNLELDAMNNGLTHVIEKFKYSNIAGHITLLKGERSRLASKASEIL